MTVNSRIHLIFKFFFCSIFRYFFFFSDLDRSANRIVRKYWKIREEILDPERDRFRKEKKGLGLEL